MKRKQERQGVKIPSLAEVKAAFEAKLKAIAADPQFKAAVAAGERFRAAQAEAFKVQQAYEQALAPYIGRELDPFGDEALFVNELIDRCNKDRGKVYERHGFHFVAHNATKEAPQAGLLAPMSDKAAAEAEVAVHARAAPATGLDVQPPLYPVPAAKLVGMSKQARALAVKVEHPDWSDVQVAQAAGCHVKSLYRWKLFTTSKAVLKEGRANLPRGSKPKEKPMEAWEDGGKDDAES